ARGAEGRARVLQKGSEAEWAWAGLRAAAGQPEELDSRRSARSARSLLHGSALAVRREAALPAVPRDSGFARFLSHRCGTREGEAGCPDRSRARGDGRPRFQVREKTRAKQPARTA